MIKFDNFPLDNDHCVVFNPNVGNNTKFPICFELVSPLDTYLWDGYKFVKVSSSTAPIISNQRVFGFTVRYFDELPETEAPIVNEMIRSQFVVHEMADLFHLNLVDRIAGKSKHYHKGTWTDVDGMEESRGRGVALIGLGVTNAYEQVPMWLMDTVAEELKKMHQYRYEHRDELFALTPCKTYENALKEITLTLKFDPELNIAESAFITPLIVDHLNSRADLNDPATMCSYLLAAAYELPAY